jgi:hypothetical protein
MASLHPPPDSTSTPKSPSTQLSGVPPLMPGLVPIIVQLPEEVSRSHNNCAGTNLTGCGNLCFDSKRYQCCRGETMVCRMDNTCVISGTNVGGYRVLSKRLSRVRAELCVSRWCVCKWGRKKVLMVWFRDKRLVTCCMPENGNTYFCDVSCTDAGGGPQRSRY